MFEIYSINCYGPEIIGLYRKKLLILKIIGNIKLRVKNFGYVMAVDVTIMYINFKANLQVFVKGYGTTCPNALRLAVCVKDGVVNIPTKFEVNWRNLNFFGI